MGRVQPPAIALARRGAWESHTLFFEPAACDCSECWVYVGTPQDARSPPNRRPFPPLSHRINGLTPISHPYVA
jgi:hypothetical protein